MLVRLVGTPVRPRALAIVVDNSSFPILPKCTHLRQEYKTYRLHSSRAQAFDCYALTAQYLLLTPKHARAQPAALRLGRDVCAVHRSVRHDSTAHRRRFVRRSARYVVEHMRPGPAVFFSAPRHDDSRRLDPWPIHRTGPLPGTSSYRATAVDRLPRDPPCGAGARRQ